MDAIQPKEENMKKISIVALALAIVAPNAHAGLLDSLLGTKEKEPTTLAEACNTDEIKSVCPEIVLSDMSIAECLKQNVTKLSTKCAGFIKKTATEKIGAMTASAADGASVKSEAAAKIEQATAEAAAKKAAAQAAAADVKESAAGTAAALKETGNGLLNLFK